MKEQKRNSTVLHVLSYTEDVKVWTAITPSDLSVNKMPN